LKGMDVDLKVGDIARKDYVVAHPGETVDDVTREMLVHNVDNVVVVEGNGRGKPVGVARAADILRLRRWVVEEEGYEARAQRGERPASEAEELEPHQQIDPHS